MMWRADGLLAKVEAALAEASAPGGPMWPEDLLALARRASRPEGKRSGGFAMSVSQLRKAIQDLLTPTTSQLVQNSTKEPREAPPFVTDTVSAILARRLSEQDIRALEEALEQARAEVNTQSKPSI